MALRVPLFRFRRVQQRAASTLLLSEVYDASTLPPSCDLEHGLSPTDLDALAKIRRRRRLHRSAIFRALEPRIDAALDGFVWRLDASEATPQTSWPLHAVAWNVERGKRFAPLMGLLTEHEHLRDADLLLLTEVDIGMGRSGNLHVPFELAQRLGMRCVFANSHLVLSPGDSAERDHGQPNTRALHGCALLTKLPVRRFCAVTLPEYVDKFHALEKRLGCKRALLVELEAPPNSPFPTLTVAVVHLDPFCPPRHRAAQMDLVLRACTQFAPGQPVLLGGDLNTNTYNLTSGLTLVADLFLRLARQGIERTIDHYRYPQRLFERGLFAHLQRAAFDLESFNDIHQGTLYYDVDDPEVVEKSLAYLPKPLWEHFRKRLTPWQGVVALHLDWFAGLGLRGENPRVIARAAWNGERVSDHDPICVDVWPA